MQSLYTNKVANGIYLRIDKDANTKKIEAEWTMTVWSEQQRTKILEHSFNYVFERGWGWGMPLGDFDVATETAMLCTFKIKKWNVESVKPVK